MNGIRSLSICHLFPPPDPRYESIPTRPLTPVFIYVILIQYEKGEDMPKKNRPLPKPPKTPFGRKKRFGDAEDPETLMADRMAIAAAEGRLDEFFEKEMPGSEHARKLAEMMMGMTGMMPGETTQEKSKPSHKPSPEKKSSPPEDMSSAAEPPEGVVDAVKNADVKGLMDLLEKEHRKRQGGKAGPATKKKQGAAPAKNQASVEKEVIEQLLKIAADNSLGIDWVVFRALKRYVEEYRKTGNL